MVYEHFKATPKQSISAHDGGVISVVNSSRNGKRLVLSHQLLKKIGFDWDMNHKVEFIPLQGGIGIGVFPVFGDDGNAFTPRPQGKKAVVYSSKLVEEVSEHLSLHFEDGTVCRTLHHVRYRKNKVGRYAIVTWEEAK